MSAQDPAILRTAKVIEGKSAQDQTVREDLRQVVPRYLSLLGCNAVALVFSFGSTLLLTKQLGPAGYGRWSTLMSVVTGTVIVGTSWTLVGLVRLGCEEFLREGSIRQAFWERTALLLGSLLAVGLVLWAGQQRLPDPVGGRGGTLVLVLAGAVASALSLHAQHALQAAKQMGRAGFVQILERGVLFVGLVVLGWWGAVSVEGALGAFVAGGLVGAGSLWFLFDRRLWLPVCGNRRVRRELMLFSLPYLALYGFGFLSTGYVDILILKVFLPFDQVGEYFLAQQMAGLLTQVSTVACTVLLPTLTTASVLDRTGVVTLHLQRVVPHLVFVWSFVLALVMVVARPALPAVFGEAYRPVVLPFSILLVSCSLVGIVQFGYAPLVNAYQMTWGNTLIAIAASLVNLAMDCLLIPYLGVAGCAIATVLASLVSTGLFMLLTRRVLRIAGGAVALVGTLPVVVVLGACILEQGAITGVIALLGTACLAVGVFGFFSARDAEWLSLVFHHRHYPGGRD
jgi:O-antigen/teichoic acid export membrane protein